MQEHGGYGQYCPLSMAAEILCNRWTVLVLRRLLEGSTGFNEIRRGVPLISRTVLAQRLKEFESYGLVSRDSEGAGKPVVYRLTQAGMALGEVVHAIAAWGQEWIDVEPSLADVDTDFLMWDIRRNVRHLPGLPDRFVVRFHFPDAVEGKRRHWLVFEREEVDLCYIDPGFDLDVQIEAPLKTMVRIWIGSQGLSSAIASGEIQIDGLRKFTSNAADWLGLGSLSAIQKRPVELRVLRATG
ncbi:helix-turn-helix domain-containing protein [Mesorhizobium sp. M7A.F.Ca.US.008.03.1.1]|uniref:winged helix-turn-helix transcriptional regulator n=1 Tax=Mesorhizobium sp. M7A.F.Ca.US.008.03.1.1 TaxID=2496742 RepID=UPI000FCACAF8|nr:helix-turn-helix domain-containing protein [Mesorhizobium sp. M7A.F.Ca.US.008.03.1.1]RUW58493.1 transcriptional regulator [Mesorhizobium sp. M7A.F.Ca.US.008.03.1.1]